MNDLDTERDARELAESLCRQCDYCQGWTVEPQTHDGLTLCPTCHDVATMHADLAAGLDQVWKL